MPKIGEVYKSAIPYSGRDDGAEAKLRYFIYLGSSRIFDIPICYYFETTTTKGHDEAALERLKEQHPKTCIDFKSTEKGFPDHCVLCLDYIDAKCQTFEKDYKLEFQNFSISSEKLHEILVKLEAADISPKDKKNIKESFSIEGVK
ncbi:MAG: hypothetical protein IJJ71_01750 [Treponema sp.]|uniref:hypothetical protein n=1 Tax=Treponema sp. TaxID=166 RepID=UPI0025DC93A6|nr:hypothetical protein [Treponema sp.]MBR0494884.1 hypothetical protein [Treponema sp.]